MARDERLIQRESDTPREITRTELISRFLKLERLFGKHRHIEATGLHVPGGGWDSGFAPGDFHGFKGIVELQEDFPGGNKVIKVFDDTRKLIAYIGIPFKENNLSSNLGSTNFLIAAAGGFGGTQFARFSLNTILSPSRMIVEVQDPVTTEWQYEYGPDVFGQRDAYDNFVVHMPPGYIDGLDLTFTSASVVTIGIGQCRDTTDFRFLVADSSITADMTVAGAGGIQGGSSETADTWYEVHIIADIAGNNAVDSLLTPAGVAINLPSGYNISRRVGMIRNDGSSDIVEFVQFGEGRQRRYHWLITFADKFVLVGGSATTATTVTLSSLMPPTSEEAYLTFLNDGNRDSNVRRSTGEVPLSIIPRGTQVVTRFPTSSTQTMAYDHTSGGGTRDFNIIVDGFYEDL